MIDKKPLVYFYTYKTNVKERWKNKSLVDVLSYEFRTRTKEYFTEAIAAGVITVNDKIVSTHYKLRLPDYIKHTVHMHEPQLDDIYIIKMEDDYVVVHKPPGVPCHPTGGYLEYSVTKKIFKDRKVACVNRLDMPVSGVLIIAFNNLQKCMSMINETEKVYIAKVKGKFHDSISCDAKIYCEEGRRRYVDNDRGKDCLTKFKLIEYKNDYSLVECRPITGRTHQIRIHLKHLGYPILMDIIYGEENKTDCIEVHTIGNDDIMLDKTEYKKCDTISEVKDEKIECVLRNCKGEYNRSFEIKSKHICLHAWKYRYNGAWYYAEWPRWAKM